MITGSSRRRAFTLIELLVVVAIIALLISILLPSLNRAREQAKTVKCVAQLKDIGNAMTMYFVDEKEWFPFEKRNWPASSAPLHGFYYGGHPGRRVAPGSTEWWGYVRPEWRDTPAGRPFNPYLYPDLPNWDVRRQDDPVLFKRVREDMAVYQCPSDVGGFWNTQTDQEHHDKPTHWATGSSYDCNYHYVWCWAAPRMPPPDGLYLQVANHFLRYQRRDHSSTFVILFEDPFDSGQWNNIPRRGWHRQWNVHSFLFLDGHAANMLADATNGNRGLGWKTASGTPDSPFTRWWEDPQDPDYVYRNLGP